MMTTTWRIFVIPCGIALWRTEEWILGGPMGLELATAAATSATTTSRLAIRVRLQLASPINTSPFSAQTASARNYTGAASGEYQKTRAPCARALSGPDQI